MHKDMHWLGVLADFFLYMFVQLNVSFLYQRTRTERLHCSIYQSPAEPLSEQKMTF